MLFLYKNIFNMATLTFTVNGKTVKGRKFVEFIKI